MPKTPEQERLDAQPTATVTPEERAMFNTMIGRLHAVLRESQITMEKLGNADPHPQWKAWFLGNAQILGAMRRRLFSYLN